MQTGVLGGSFPGGGTQFLCWDLGLLCSPCPVKWWYILFSSYVSRVARDLKVVSWNHIRCPGFPSTLSATLIPLYFLLWCWTQNFNEIHLFYFPLEFTSRRKFSFHYAIRYQQVRSFFLILDSMRWDAKSEVYIIIIHFLDQFPFDDCIHGNDINFVGIKAFSTTIFDSKIHIFLFLISECFMFRTIRKIWRFSVTLRVVRMGSSDVVSSKLLERYAYTVTPNLFNVLFSNFFYQPFL